MDRRIALTAPLRCRRGTTLIEVMVCLVILGLFVTGFVRHLGAAAASGSRLAERTKAEGAARGVRALLSAEDPWSAPESRTLLVGADGGPSRGGDTFEARIDGTTLCDAATVPGGAGAGVPPAPGGCPGGARAVRRWRIVVTYLSRYSAGGQDSVTSTVDVDEGSPAAPPAGVVE